MVRRSPVQPQKEQPEPGSPLENHGLRHTPSRAVQAKERIIHWGLIGRGQSYNKK